MSGDPRPSRERTVGAACGLGGFLLIAILLAPSLAGRRAFLPADYWMTTVPDALAFPRATRGFPTNALLGDQASIVAPRLWLLHQALRRAELPLWIAQIQTGEPVLASGPAAPLAPTTWPVLLLPWPLGFAWSALAKFGVMWLGAYLYGRSLGLTRAWATSLGVAFSFAPLFVVHFQQPRAGVHVWLPWMLWRIERIAAAAPSGAGAAARAALPLAFIEAAAAISGYPPALLTIDLCAGLYLLVCLPWSPRRVALWTRAVAIAALALGVAIAAPVLLPFADALRSSGTLADRSTAEVWTLSGDVTRLFWDPYAFGSPTVGAARGWTGPDNFEEAQQYIGIVPWLFLAAGLAKLLRRPGADRLRAAVLAGVGGFAVVLAFGVPPLHGWLTAIPPFRFNANPRLLFLLQVALPTIAALTAREWLAAPRAMPRAFAAAIGLAASGALASVWLAAAEQWSMRPWLLAGSALALYAAGRCTATARQRQLAAALVPLLWLCDVGPVYARLHPQVPRAWADPARGYAALPTPLRDEVAARRSDPREPGAPAPRAAFESVTPPNLPAVFGVEDVRGYSFPSPLRYDRYAYEVMGVQAAMNLVREDLTLPSVLAGLERTCASWLLTTNRYEGTPLADRVERAWSRRDRIFLYRLTRASPCAAWYASDAVTRVADLDAAVAELRASLDRDAEKIIVEGAGARAASSPSTGSPLPATFRWRGANAIEVEVPAAARDRDGWLVLRVSHDPGWSAATERGAPLHIVPAQVRFLAVEVPAGTERIELRYAPPHWALALAVAGAALALLGASWIATRARR